MKKGRKPVNDFDRAIAAQLMRLRNESGLSREDVARKIGVTSQQIRKYESGADRLRVGRLIQLANAIGVPPGKILDGAGKVPKRAA